MRNSRSHRVLALLGWYESVSVWREVALLSSMCLNVVGQIQKPKCEWGATCTLKKRKMEEKVTIHFFTTFLNMATAKELCHRLFKHSKDVSAVCSWAPAALQPACADGLWHQRTHYITELLVYIAMLRLLWFSHIKLFFQILFVVFGVLSFPFFLYRFILCSIPFFCLHPFFSLFPFLMFFSQPVNSEITITDVYVHK